MPRAVVFDIDNTLYSYDEAHAAAYSTLREYARRELSLTPERFDALHREAAHRLETHSGRCAAIHNRLIRYQLLLEAVGLPIRHAPAMAALYWTTLLESMKPYSGVREAFETLRAMGLTLGIGTNMTADHQFEKLERLGLLGLVDFMVTSEEVSAEKPDRRLFDLCAEKACCPNGDCAFVGDSLKGDVQGAMDAGMTAVWFHPSPDDAGPPEGAHRLRSFQELPELIQSL